MNKINIKSIEIFEKYNVRIVNPHNFVELTDVNPILSADIHSLIFIDAKARNKNSLLSSTHACVIICNFIPEDENLYASKCLIVTSNPKLLFAKIVNSQLPVLPGSIHPSAVIHPKAKIADNCYIGAHCYIGECEIGENTIIYPNTSIYDNVHIGKSVVIDSGTVIGSAGFGFVREDDGTPVRFPQLGGVIIKDYVEIGANSCIDRGALQNTIIHDHVKIDNMVQIGHNVVIGENTYIIGHCGIGGSVEIGRNCWIAATKIINKISIEDNVTVGFGSVVLNNLKSNQTYMGNPAREIRKYTRIQYNLKKNL